MTIEERAFNNACNSCVHKGECAFWTLKFGDNRNSCGYIKSYIQGATEQQKIDIEKAWEYIKAMIDYALNGGDITHITKDCVTKAMEEKI